MSFFNSRAFIGSLLLFAFLTLVVTSFLLFTKHHNPRFALVHTLVGFVLILGVLWHLSKNFRSLLRYLNPLKKYAKKRTISMPIAFLIVGYFVASPYFNLNPAWQVYWFGQSLKASDKQSLNLDKEVKYIQRNIQPENSQGQTLTLELKKGPYFMWPQYAFWLETMEGEFVQPLYVTRKIATNNFINKVVKKDPDQVFDKHIFLGEDTLGFDVFEDGLAPDTKDTRMRPESVPVFLHQLGLQTDNGFYLPTDSKLVADGFSGATMTDNFIYSIKLSDRLSGQYRVRFEVNHSFDYNEYYSSDRFPNDPIYSGDGYTAQPSVIYQTIIDFGNPSKLLQMEVVGHGHHSGQNGDVYPDTSKLTTALELVERILVTYKN
jgi:hypothetical protein